MPPRPSRNLDRALLAAGRELFPTRGCAGLSVREVADAAGVNLGMFHYHFKSREAFLRALLQSVYEEMFAELSQRTQGLAQVNEAAASADFLRRALQFMGRFLRANRPILARVLADALSNDPIATEFLQRNLPRHLELLTGIIAAGQEDGTFRPLAPAQLLGFCAGSLAMPILFGGAVAERLPGTPTARNIDAALLTDEALDQRIELALAAISSPGRNKRAAPRARARKPRGKP